MIGYIYKITNKLNGKVYVGQHTSEEFDEEYWGSGTLIVKSIEKHKAIGDFPECFDREVLQWCETLDELNFYETYWIEKLNCRIPNGYNIMYGGFNHQCPPEVREKIINTKRLHPTKRKDYTVTEETRLKISKSVSRVTSGAGNINYGKQLSEETRKKISVSLSSKCWVNNGEDSLCVLKSELDNYLSSGYEIGSLFNKGKPAYNKGVPMKNEQKEKLSAAITGRKWVNNGKEQKQVKPEEIDEYLSNGYSLGRIRTGKPAWNKGIACAESTKSKLREHALQHIMVHNDIETIYILREDLDKYLELGYIKGHNKRKKIS